jgi:hypothetical protein
MIKSFLEKGSEIDLLKNSLTRNNRSFAVIMGFTKERKKLEKLSEKITGLQQNDAKSLAIITDIYEQYSHTARILKNKEPDAFNDLYLNELQEVKACKRNLKLAEEDEIREVNFNKYKDALIDALTKTIQAANNLA